MLPLPECAGPAQCKCVYVHFDDRRSDPRRGSDAGLHSAYHPNDQRTGYGRRATDRR